MVSFDCCGAATFSVLCVLVVEMLVSLSEFLDHEFLELDDVDNIKQCLNVVKDHNAELASDTAVAVFPCDYEHSLHELAAQALTQIVLHMNWLIMLYLIAWSCGTSRHQCYLCLSKFTKRRMKKR